MDWAFASCGQHPVPAAVAEGAVWLDILKPGEVRA
jgi:hypothetical protein